MYAISRIQAKPGIWCWAVHFRRRGKGYYRSFYDVRRGGSKQALAAAVAWRDRLLASTKALSMREFRQIKRTSNQSGAPGVLFIRPTAMPQGMWQARIKFPGGYQIAKSFGVKKHGERAAFRLAVAARTHMLELIDDQPFLHAKTARQFAARSAAKAKTSCKRAPPQANTNS